MRISKEQQDAIKAGDVVEIGPAYREGRVERDGREGLYLVLRVDGLDLGLVPVSAREDVEMMRASLDENDVRVWIYTTRVEQVHAGKMKL